MGLLTRHRLGNVAIDVVLLFVAWYASFFLRFDVISPYWAHLRDAGSWRFVAVQVVVLIAMRVYLRQWRYTSLRDVLALGQALLVGGILAYGSMWLLPPIDRGGNDPLPRGVVVLDLVLAGLLLVTARAVARIVFERPGPFVRGRRGAGDRRRQRRRADRARDAEEDSGYTPIAILDDDPAMQGLRLHGVKVSGTIDDSTGSSATPLPDEVVIAMPSAPGARRQTWSTSAGARHPRPHAARSEGAARRRLAGDATARRAGRGPARPPAGPPRPGRDRRATWPAAACW